LPLHGNPVYKRNNVENYTAYRFHLGDVVPFSESIRVSMEHGPTNDIAGDYESVAFYYRKPAKGLVATDSLDVGNPASEAAHGYVVEDQTWAGSRTYSYEGEHDDVHVTDDGRAFLGASEFTVSCSPTNAGVVLRRRSDVTVRHQTSRVFVDGEELGLWYNEAGNIHHQWRDSEFLIPASHTAGKSSLAVRLEFHVSSIDWNEFYYWVYSWVPPETLDSDGDRMPDAYEVDEGLSIMTPDAGLDEDRDGVDNGDEYVAGTRASDASSVLNIDRVEQAENGNLRLHFEGKAGREYRVVTARLGETGITWSEAEVVGLARGQWLGVSASGSAALEVVPGTASDSYRVECRLAR